MANITESAVKFINNISSTIARLSYVVFTLSVISITANVIMRYVFDKPILGTDEINRYLIPVMAYLGIAYTQLRKNHVRITLLTMHLDKIYRKSSRIVGYILGILVTLFIFKASLDYAIHAFSVGETTLVGASTWPIWWSRFALPIGMLLLAIQFISDILNEKICEKRGI